MRIGVVFPQTEIGADPAAVRAYAQAVQDMGYEHLLIYDHVLTTAEIERNCHAYSSRLGILSCPN